MHIWPCCEDKSLYNVTVFIQTDFPPLPYKTQCHNRQVASPHLFE